MQRSNWSDIEWKIIVYLTTFIMLWTLPHMKFFSSKIWHINCSTWTVSVVHFTKRGNDGQTMEVLHHWLWNRSWSYGKHHCANEGVITLSLISLFMTLPFVHKDAHLVNICVRDHHRLYNYTRGKIFELTWQAFGVYSVIDWNSSDVSCVRQNSISHFPIPLNKFTKDFERSYPWRRRRSITVITSSYEQNWQDPVHTQIFGRYRKSHTSFVSFASNNFQQVLQYSGSCFMPNLRG